MTTKAHRLIPQTLAAVLTLFGAAACSTTTASAPAPTPQAEANEPPTVFKCIQQGSGWATTVEKGNITTKAPLITWDTTEFGGNYTPDKRCEIVSKKLTKAVADSGGKLDDVQLTVGFVNNQNVVCVLDKSSTECTSKNMLFTLSDKNSKNPHEALEKILRFNEGKATGVTVSENANSSSILLINLVGSNLAIK
ncbi:COP23 domain-containing protein [Microcoleus sp. PH2017_02_FOX_O_A]|uniref:COP23 domain-containing protein n=1 Tax=Microcoleus sp. PH2017_02_FOX_O_A TaxID=2798813 RepID=UPI001D8426A7|nr:COP23 domain-containing protein [Microcoleus sp. PH2017_02_FOX_O_A]MCC3410355.1 COP23 domain-containing protein [Microcoleus sp. PH2017_02_FOX_O_A]